MTPERAVEICKYGEHARPKASEKDRRTAFRMVLNDPALRNSLRWADDEE